VNCSNTIAPMNQPVKRVAMQRVNSPRWLVNVTLFMSMTLICLPSETHAWFSLPELHSGSFIRNDVIPNTLDAGTKDFTDMTRQIERLRNELEEWKQRCAALADSQDNNQSPIRSVRRFLKRIYHVLLKSDKKLNGERRGSKVRFQKNCLQHR